MVRRDIIDKVLNRDPDPEKRRKRRVTIASSGAMAADHRQIAKEMKLDTGSIAYSILKSFCEKKKASTAEAKALVQRMKNLTDHQLKIVKWICGKKNFTVAHILECVLSIRKFGEERLLMLRSYCDLKGVGPGQLLQFFRMTLPQSTPKEVGKDAYEKELNEKTIRPDQINVFFNICHQLSGITPGTAITILPKIRQLKHQHTQLMTAFLKKDSSFGDKPINDDNVKNLLHLWTRVPVLTDKTVFNRLLKKLAQEPEEKKSDLKYVIHSLMVEEKKMNSNGKFAGIRNFFGSN